MPRVSIYPGHDPGEFFGVRRPVAATLGGAGGAWRAVVPGSEMWRVVLCSYRFTTSAAVANRFPGFAIQDADQNEVWAARSGLAQVASLIDRVAGSSAGGTTSSGVESGRVTIVLPDVLLTPGFSLVSSVGGIDVADVADQVNLHVEAFDYGSDGWRSGPVYLPDTASLPEEG